MPKATNAGVNSCLCGFVAHTYTQVYAKNQNYNTMSIIKSYTFTEGKNRGDMYYIADNSSNFTLIDCYLKVTDERKTNIIDEILNVSQNKKVLRFILTHPHDDHYHGIEELFKVWKTTNIYAVCTDVPKGVNDPSSIKCRELLQGKTTCQIEAGLKRAYLNRSGSHSTSSGIDFLWPKRNNPEFSDALQDASKGVGINDISPVILYHEHNNASFMWMGDMEVDMQTEFYNACHAQLKPVDILFAPHHGRKSGKVSKELLDILKPKIIVIGNAPSEDLDYYDSYDTITSNSAGDILFDANGSLVHIYAANEVGNLPTSLIQLQLFPSHAGMHYLGTLFLNLS